MNKTTAYFQQQWGNQAHLGSKKKSRRKIKWSELTYLEKRDVNHMRKKQKITKFKNNKFKSCLLVSKLNGDINQIIWNYICDFNESMNTRVKFINFITNKYVAVYQFPNWSDDDSIPYNELFGDGYLSINGLIEHRYIKFKNGMRRIYFMPGVPDIHQMIEYRPLIRLKRSQHGSRTSMYKSSPDDFSMDKILKNVHSMLEHYNHTPDQITQMLSFMLKIWYKKQ